ncbi:YlmH family RNA-binding protein [Dethiobacter alkaliphilus]|uniref:YlmH family RNA-binding protein n=1 Tax=Dethiobacter alkaliphilus TaxID=427926 RepID=UPI0022270888|nr:YlmH/Sll1252 family protein [Dethiobacter alkaliphilus]MCW3491210.1 YlmH/Sll1252 family protein [Dethiobacter alkaliphilus]
MEREKILQRFEQDIERITAGAVLDRIALLEKTAQPQSTDFLDPFQQRTADRVLHLFKDVKSVTWGGYPGAERARLLVYPSQRQADKESVPLAFIEAEAHKADGLTHRDYLGAVLGLGLRREKLGDILLTGESKAQLVVHPEILSFLLTNWGEVGKYSVSVKEITADELAPTPPRVREIKTTVASLRLDSVASAGFGMSRSKLSPAVKSGQIKLNWQSVTSASATVKEGDIISLAGRGRVEVAEVRGQSKKGRIQLLLKKRI